MPKRAFDPLIFARWRCWKEYGTGVAGDLLVHLISGMQYVTGINEPPKRAMAMGGILRWKDGRNMPDVHSTLFEYGNIPVYLRLNLGTETPEIYCFMGSKGILELTEFSATYIPQPRVDLSPSYYASGFPKRMREAYFKQWHQEHDPVPGQEPALEGIICFLGRGEAALLGFLPDGSPAKAGCGRRGVWSSCGAGLPHGE